MSSDHATSDDHGHGPTVPESELIKESSPQDWLLILAAVAIIGSLTWYGWQWAATPISTEAEGHAAHSSSEPVSAEPSTDAHSTAETLPVETSAPAESSTAEAPVSETEAQPAGGEATTTESP